MESWKRSEDLGSTFKEKLPYILFTLLLAVAFISEIAGYSGSPGAEYDPYMYGILVKVLSVTGSIPISGMAYPCGASCSSNRFEPLQPYLMAGYYDIGQMLGYADLIQTMVFIAPILFVVLITFIFVMFQKRYHNAWLSLIVAGLIVSMPVIWQQFWWTGFQEEVWGFALVIAMFATYWFAMDTKKWNYTILAGMLFMATLLSSKYFTVAVTVLPAFLLLESLIGFRHEDFKKFIKQNLVILGFLLLTNVLLLLFLAGFGISGFSITI